jgi:hypothetical protein
MAQFDVYRNPNAATRERMPYLLDVQPDLLDALATRHRRRPRPRVYRNLKDRKLRIGNSFAPEPKPLASAAQIGALGAAAR